MAYWTEFSGSLVIRPGLPLDFITRWNMARRGTPGRQYVRRFDPAAPGETIDEPDMLPGIDHHGKPQEWCQWRLVPATSLDREPATLVLWDGRDHFVEYDRWLQVLVDVVERDVGAHAYDGVIRWDGEDPDDSGMLFVLGSRGEWSVTTEFEGA